MTNLNPEQLSLIVTLTGLTILAISMASYAIYNLGTK